MRVGYIDFQILQDSVKVIFHSELDGRRTKTMELYADNAACLAAILMAFAKNQRSLAERHERRARSILDEMTRGV